MSGGVAVADRVRRVRERSARIAAARRFELGAVALALLAGAVVWWLATDLFAYRSVNDDEGVYLLQAAMLLEGRLFLRPGPLAEAVRPWFFVAGERGGGTVMYGKYSPVVPATFAAARALTGSYDPALAAVAAGVVGLVALLGRDAADARVGLLAAAFVLASPLFLFPSSVFLPYAPTMLLNLLFAVGYVRAARTGRRRWAALAGAAVGLAFFSRPYTAVCFAAPFLLHALAVLARAARDGRVDRSVRRAVFERYAVMATLGLAGVALALGYNWTVTGDPLVFPYEAFAPRDGLGFGERELLGHELDYTPALGVESSGRALSMLFGGWVAAGWLGTGFAAAGLVLFFERWWRGGARLRPRIDGLGDGEVTGLLAGVGASVALGNVAFWGVYNGLANGLFDLLGPYYHLDLLVPFGVFAAVGVVRGGEALASLLAGRFDRRAARVALATLLVVSLPLVAAAEASVVADPYGENRQRTGNLAATYEPFEGADLENALVFVPDPYGDWTAHPFQRLRNEPGFDDGPIYAVDGEPDRDLRTVDAAGDRQLYRFTYRGEWTGAVRPVDPDLRRLRVLTGDRVDARTVVGVPAGSTGASVRVETGEGYARYSVEDLDGRVAVNWSVGPSGVRVGNLDRTGDSHSGGPNGSSGETGDVPLPAGASEVDLVVTFAGRTGESVTYRQALTVERDGGAVRVLWPPETRVCRLETDCGREGTWVGPGGDYLDGVSVEADAAVGTNATAQPSASTEADAASGANPAA
ncbi:DUF7846 domain-containing protein [Halorarum salinum]|uniref:Glycosyltransferase family 39 protein n=1 Tax=Halorarum salinum TaxID=2743089 RepID=A0A7D5QE92_9EURY|nr:glycosyltransferase family 39 protein [Halobaculum salinum]QLG63880.1 glycosyltransferase family 39 protein [Halobaculum salinum]